MPAPADRRSTGWSWFAEPDGAPDPEVTALARAFARCFADGDGERVLACLDGLTIGRVLGPDASDAALRHLEGQRQLVIHIHAMIDRGRGLG
ncbi:MAG: hypothetical protein H7840_17420 [Alphaproteobacteria bacterium]